MSIARRLVFSLLKFLEKVATYGQGKGYGAATIAKEVETATSFFTEPPKLAIDVGGNIGNYTAELTKAFNGLEIHTFEPSSVNIAKLNDRFGNIVSITVVPLALSDSRGEAKLYADRAGSGLGSLTKRKLDHFNINFDFSEEIKSITFEDYWENELKSRDIDLVKLDVEGNELKALKGFGAALKSCKVIQFEFGGCNIDTRTYFQDFWYFFVERHFDLYRITPIGCQKIENYAEQDEFFSTTNFIAVNKSI